MTKIGLCVYLISVRKDSEQYSKTVNIVLDQEMSQIVKEQDLNVCNQKYLEQNTNSFMARVAGNYFLHYFECVVDIPYRITSIKRRGVY